MQPEHDHPKEGAPEWMVSYADMITIMMAFFVVMYALSGRNDETAARPVISSLKQQFGPDWPFANLVPGPHRARSAQLDRLQMNARHDHVLGNGPGGDEYRSQPPARIARPGDGLWRGGDILFDDDRVALTDQQRLQLQRLATDIAGKPQKIEVRGHAARRVLPTGSEYHDAWDVAFARAREVVKYLIDLGIDAHRIRIGVAGSGEPLGAADGSPDRARHSRVEIHLLNEFVTNPAS
jgi:chemotaxis protein MotB